MKKVIYLILCCANIALTANSQNYYWYKGEQIPLSRGNMRYIIFNQADSNDVVPDSLIETGDVHFLRADSMMWGIAPIDEIYDTSKAVYQTESYLSPDSTRNIYVTHRFYVKLRDLNDYNLLSDYANRYGAEIEKEGEVSSWYIISCTANSTYNAIELANLFYETGLFAAAEPEFINIIRPLCTNDTHFSDQWNLKNTGQYGSESEGIDINYCEAHTVTSGKSNVVIGVYDTGIQLSHPDLNLSQNNYDVHTTLPENNIYDLHHGTECAGIINAQTNNNIGVAGIAPECTAISICYSPFHSDADELARGFRYAKENNVAVINCSWEIVIRTDYLQNALDSAISFGRNGLGCVVVFAAGNEGTMGISYPANSNPDIIVVGAIAPNGKRKQRYDFDDLYWSSNYGTHLDVMAPGLYIPTTDMGGNSEYTSNFYGTSAAAPHVSAIAGLLLSVNPNLTQKEVADIIESTAQKVQPNNSNYNYYNYSTTEGRPNGTWNIEMGYGLVDAYAAVLEAKARLPIQGPDEMCDTAKYYLIHPSQPEETVQWSIYDGHNFNPLYSIVGSSSGDTVIVRFENNRGEEGINSRIIGDSMIYPNTVELSVNIYNTSSGISKTYRKDLHHAHSVKPTISVSSPYTLWPSQTIRTFTVTNCSAVPDSAFKWTLKRIIPPKRPNNPPIIRITNYYGRTCSYWAPTIPQTRRDTLDVFVTNLAGECGEINSDTLRYILAPGLLLLNGSIDGTQLNISIREENDNRQQGFAQLNDNSSYTLELWHSIYGCMRTQSVQSATEQMNITGLPSGIYVLLLKENGIVIAETKIPIQ